MVVIFTGIRAGYFCCINSNNMNQATTISTLHQLLDHDARKFISAEVILRQALPVWITRCGSLNLKTVLQKYHDEVEAHLVKFEDFVTTEQISSLTLVNGIMEAYVADINDKMHLCSDSEVRDAVLLAGIQLINHYKISIYGTAAAFARALDMEQAATIFYSAEAAEKQTDSRLSQLAEFDINKKARSPFSLQQF